MLYIFLSVFMPEVFMRNRTIIHYYLNHRNFVTIVIIVTFIFFI